MRKYGYNRPSQTLYVRRRAVRRKQPSFFFRFLTLLLVAGVLGVGGFWALRYGYGLVKNAQITDWHVKTVAVSGMRADIEKELLAQASTWEGKPFSLQQAQQLSQEITTRYPMLKQVAVTRGLLTGKLKITAKEREAVARFVLPDQTYKYIDKDSVVYADSKHIYPVPQVELAGNVPGKLEPSFVELVQSVLKLKKSLQFESLQFDLEKNTVTMRLPDKSVIRFGSAQQLKSKATRAAQIIELARNKYHQPVTVDFEFFKWGKVFLTLSAY